MSKFKIMSNFILSIIDSYDTFNDAKSELINMGFVVIYDITFTEDFIGSMSIANQTSKKSFKNEFVYYLQISESDRMIYEYKPQAYSIKIEEGDFDKLYNKIRLYKINKLME